MIIETWRVPVSFLWPLVPFSGVVSLPFSPTHRPKDASKIERNPIVKAKMIAKMILFFMMEVLPISKRSVHYAK